MNISLPIDNRHLAAYELYEEACKAQTREEAVAYFNNCLIRLRLTEDTNATDEDRRRLLRNNIAYAAGYYDHETRKRVEALYDCVHPYLGPANDKLWSPEECFELGKSMGSGKYVKRYENSGDPLEVTGQTRTRELERNLEL